MDKQENTTTVSAPTTDELKERFDARSIPLAIDFANLIDVAEYGRRALGKHPQQNPEPASGLQMVSEGQLTVKLAPNKGLAVDHQGVGINTVPAHGLKLEESALKLAISASNPGVEVVADGVKVKAHAAAGIKVDSNGVGVVANAAKGMVVEAAGVGINTAAAHGLKLEGNALKLAVSASNPGLEVVADGVKVKAHAAAGIKVDANGVGVVANAAKGMVVEAAGVGINTAAAHGLKLEGNALKLAVSASNPGLEVVADGVKVKGHTAAGIKVDANGVGVNAGNGIACANNQVNIKLAKGPIHNGGGGQGSDNAISGSNGGLCLSAAGLSVDAGNGIEINANGVSVKCYPNWGLGVSESGLWVVPNTGAGVKVDSFGVGVVANAVKGMLVDSNGVGINTAAPYGLKLEANALKLAVSASNPGVEVVTDGMRVKANAAAGVRVDGAGVGVVTNNAKGIAVDGQGLAVSVGNGLIAANNKINIKLAKGDFTNGTESAGSNGTIIGPSGGLHLSDNGLSVNPGNGICLDGVGVSIKCAANSALTASELGGLNLNVDSNRGLSIVNNRLGANIGNGLAVTSNKLVVNHNNSLMINGNSQLGVNTNNLVPTVFPNRITSLGRHCVFYTGVDGPCTGSATFILNKHNMFKLEWTSYQSYTITHSTSGVISISGVRGTFNDLIEAIYFGESSSTGWGAQLCIDFKIACDVVMIYNPMDCAGVTWAGMSKDVMNYQTWVKIIPQQLISQTYAW